MTKYTTKQTTRGYRIQIRYANQDLKASKYQLKKAQQNYRVLKRKGLDVTKAKSHVRDMRRQLQEAKKKKKTLLKKSGRKPFRYLVGDLGRKVVTELSNSTLQQDETLGRWVEAKHKYQHIRSNVYAVKKGTKRTYRVGKGIGKFAYGTGNRTYNVLRGRGFRRTPQQFSWQTQLKNRLQKRLAQNRLFQYTNGLRKHIAPAFYPLRRFTGNFLKNPVSLFGIFNLFLILLIVAPSMTVGTLTQNEFDLTDTWNYLTKVDREKSNDKVKYYTDIDDILMYINYRYDNIRKEYPIDTAKSMPDNPMGKTYLNTVWGDLNNDTTKLKKMKDLYSVEGLYSMKPNELEEYNNRLKMAEQLGRYIQMNDLSNFFVDKNNPTKVPLKIISRHGYTSSTELQDTSTFKADAGVYLYASMKGVVSVDGTTVEISDEKRRLTYFGVENIRVTDGQNVKTGDMIGQVNAQGNQRMKYEKLGKVKSGEKDAQGKVKLEWKAVNIGFYLLDVTYTQKTSVIPKTSISGDKAQRVREFVKALKTFIPDATNEGIAAMLGNFDIESGIRAKMAEGDYLAPPVGKTDDSSYDDPNWLDIGGVPIYGRYPNIIHRGIGLGQWTDTSDGSTRHTLLRQYADARGKKWYDLDLQVDFMVNGDTPFYKKTLSDIVHSTEDVGVLTERFLDRWEGNPGDKVEQRIASAKEWYAFLTQSGSGQPLEHMDDVMMTSYFGEVRVDVPMQDGTLLNDVHNGIDLVYKDGRSHAPIYAIESGEVVTAGNNGRAGLAVVIKHNNYYSHYYHLSELSVTVGEHVEAGAILGKMGTTGQSSGEHLHFGLSRQHWGDYYDPKPYLQLP